MSVEMHTNAEVRAKEVFEFLEIDIIGDERGNLCSIEEQKNIPFKVKRVYYMYGLEPIIPRGFHAHLKLRQVAFCLSGSVDVLMDDGRYKETIRLDKPHKGLMIEPMQWHEMRNFSKDCVLMVIASDYYDESDYIRDYDKFVELAGKRQ